MQELYRTDSSIRDFDPLLIGKLSSESYRLVMNDFYSALRRSDGDLVKLLGLMNPHVVLYRGRQYAQMPQVHTMTVDPLRGFAEAYASGGMPVVDMMQVRDLAYWARHNHLGYQCVTLDPHTATFCFHGTTKNLSNALKPKVSYRLPPNGIAGIQRLQHQLGDSRCRELG